MNTSEENNHASNRRIAKNTLMLYLRMILIMIVNLYVSRVVLKALGVEDYGLISVVGSVVSFLGFLNTSMAAASQRFLAYAKGIGSEEELNSTFNSIMVVQAIIAIIIFVLCESVGIFYISNYLNVDPLKLTAAHIVFQLSIASFLVSTITVPYNATIIANERMDVFTLLSIVDASLKLGVAFLLPVYTNNRLIAYGGLMFACVFLIQLCYRLYCKKVFKECTIRKNAKKNTIKLILSYSGWNLLGSFSSVAINQGVNMILNSFFGLVVNAARGISFQVDAAMAQFYSNFQQALNPQIVKTYAAKEFTRMHMLITQGTRFSFFLLFTFAIPVIFNMFSILKLWLVDVPDYTELFCILVLINSIIGTMSQSLLMGALATGKIRKYQIIIASINLLNIPLSIIALNIKLDPFLTTYIMIGLSIIAFVFRLVLVHYMINLSISMFINRAIKPIFITVFVTILLSMVFNRFMPQSEDILLLLIRGTVIFIFCVGCITVFGVSKAERLMLFNFVKSKIKR